MAVRLLVRNFTALHRLNTQQTVQSLSYGHSGLRVCIYTDGSVLYTEVSQAAAAVS